MRRTISLFSVSVAALVGCAEHRFAGPYPEAAAYFAKSTKSKDLSKAAVAYDKAGDAVSSRRCADLAVTTAAKSKSVRDEARARMERARLLQARHGNAAAEPDYR